MPRPPRPAALSVFAAACRDVVASRTGPMEGRFFGPDPDPET